MDTDGGIPHPSTQFLMRFPSGCMALLQGHQAALPYRCGVVSLSLSHSATSVASTIGPTRHNDNEILVENITIQQLLQQVCSTHNEEVMARTSALGGKATRAGTSGL